MRWPHPSLAVLWIGRSSFMQMRQSTLTELSVEFRIQDDRNYLAGSLTAMVGTRVGGLNRVASRPPVLLRCGL
jgi:hypothetical protein